MANTESTISSKFHAFLKKRDSKTNASIQEAQRLINLYRILNVFGPDFVDQYNNMLLNASDEVQMALNALIAGQEVRQYLEFLRQDQTGGDGEVSSDKGVPQTGWLPSPEEELPAKSEKGESNPEWTAFMKAEEEKISKMIATLKEEQELAMKHLSDQLSSTLKTRSSQTVSTSGVPEDYSEIIEEKHKEKE